jgi:cellobiose phosphorylase
MQYGHFENGRKEYVITNPKTPVRWINYVGTLNFGGYVDQTGGSLICKGDPSANRITKYLPGLPNSALNGTAFYLRVKGGQGYEIFSPFYVPCCTNADKYECRVGLLYNHILGEYKGLRLEVIFFVPTGKEVMLMDCRITNISGSDIEADFCPVVDYTHFDALKQFTNADWVPQTMMSRQVEGGQGHKVLTQFAFMKRDTAINYLAASEKCESFETGRDLFLGSNGYGSWEHPEALLKPSLSNTEVNRGDNIAAMLFSLGKLKKGESKRIVMQLGQTEKVDDVASIAAPYRNLSTVDAEFKALAGFWDDYLEAFQVETPSDAMNNMLNVHHPKQCYITKNWSRYLSSYQLGMGSRGLGMRDSSQDLLGVMAHMPEEAAELMKKLISIQIPDGSAMHQFYPLSMEASEGDAHEMPDRPQFYGDDHLWFVVTLATYIKETGNTAVLDEVIAYYDKKKKPEDREKGTIKDHLVRSLEFSRKNVGKHGIPLLGFADWNDCVNLRTGAESFFNAHLYGVALKESIELFDHLGDKTLTDKFRGYWEDMNATVNKVGWDGEWFTRYFDYDGTPLGSHKNEKGKIYVNGQSWAVMAGYAGKDRGTVAMDSVKKLLNTPNGVKISWPGFNGYDRNIGGISTYPPGAKENGGIFLHTNPWVMIAETILGRGDRAFEYYKQINPAEKDSNIYECEPYCYAQNILGDEHPQSGLARNSWLSGTSAWTYRAATWYILGIQPGFNGLKINPCIPGEWKGFKVTRKFRGGTYRITVENPKGVHKGVVTCSVNGKPADAGALPVLKKGETCDVVVVLG